MKGWFEPETDSTEAILGCYHQKTELQLKFVKCHIWI